ncbi:MAG: ZIP family metal transporter [Flavobacteriaceae bacterium]
MTYSVLILSVFLGTAIVLLSKPGKLFMQLLLAFSGAYLLSITILHLLPEVFEAKNEKIGLYILLGILIQSVLENFSKGVEHGHIHLHGKIKKIPWLLFISLSLHSFFEGIPLGNTDNNHVLLWAIVIHKVPIAIVLTTFLLQSTLSKTIVFSLIGFFALMSPLGYLLCDKISFFTTYFTEITAIIIGIFLHISTIILFESSDNHTFNFKKLMAILFGFFIAYLSL